MIAPQFSASFGSSRFGSMGDSDPARWHPVARCVRHDLPTFRDLVALVEAQQDRTPAGPCTDADVMDPRTTAGKCRSPWICAPMSEGRRLARNAAPRNWGSLDLDEGDHTTALANLITSGAELAWWETHSSTPEAPRYRIIYALDTHLDRENTARAAWSVARRYGANADACAERTEQPLFLPPAGAPVRYVEGVPMSAAALLEGVPSYAEIKEARRLALGGKPRGEGDQAADLFLDAYCMWRGGEGTVRDAIEAGVRRCNIPDLSEGSSGSPDSGFLQQSPGGKWHYIYRLTGTHWMDPVDALSLQGVQFSGQLPGTSAQPLQAPPPPPPPAAMNPDSFLRSLDFGCDLTATVWLVPDYIPEGAGIIAGEEGAGKSSWVASIVAHVCHLKELEGIPLGGSARRRALVVSEDAAQLKKILMARTGLTLDALQEHVIVMDVTRLDQSPLLDTMRLFDHMWTLPDPVDPKIRRRPLVVLDTVLSVSGLDDLNDYASTARWVREVMGAAQNVHFISHFSKGASNGKLREGSAVGAKSFQSMVQWTSVFGFEDEADTDTDVRVHYIRKSRDGVGNTSVHFRFVSVPVSLRNEYGAEVIQEVGTLRRDAGVRLDKSITDRALEAIEADGGMHRTLDDKLRRNAIAWIADRPERKRLAMAAAVLATEHPDDPPEWHQKRCTDLSYDELKSRELWGRMVNARILDEHGRLIVREPTPSEIKKREFTYWFESVTK